MLQNRISGLPVVDAQGDLVGMVTEGDFLRRGEIGTAAAAAAVARVPDRPGPARHRIRAYLRPQGRRSHDRRAGHRRRGRPLEDGRRADGTPRIKRLPVVRDGKIVGIVSRANLMHALVSLARDTGSRRRRRRGNPRRRFWRRSPEQSWAPQVNVVVERRRRRIMGHHHRRTRAASVRRRRRKCRRRQSGARSSGLGRADVGDGIPLGRG